MNILRSLTLSIALFFIASPHGNAEKLVILHTNDTHSQIDPSDDDDLGGILRRKVVADSVRAVEKNVMLIDAGDIVQGTLYFNLYKGVVEETMMNVLDYDVRILGNHEFDNGAEALASLLKGANAELLATNYDLSGSDLAPLFKPYMIKETGGKRIGFIAINLEPRGMISDGNYNGVAYIDAVKAANATSWHLKHNEKVDMVIAVTHIGYDPSTPPGDVQLARLSEDIDIIIGGHTHTLIDPAHPDPGKPWLIPNASGKDVLVVQTGKSGKFVGEITVDLDDMSAGYRLISIDRRLDDRIDKDAARLLDPYRAGVDSLMSLKVGRSAIQLDKNKAPLLNFVADFIYDRGSEIADNVDFAIINKGGIRRSLPKGDISEGMIIMMMPFNNKVNVIDIKGKDLVPAFDQMAKTDGNGVSAHVDISYDPESDRCLEIRISGKPLDPERTYRVATIDYLANGGDYMESLTKGEKIAESGNLVYSDLLDYFRKGKAKGRKINPSAVDRMHAVK